MKGIYILPVLAVISLSISTSCEKDKVAPMPVSPADTVSFSQKILPMMLNSCATSGCHDAGTEADGRNLSNYQGISDNASDALSAMKGEGGFLQMPMGMPPLPPERIQEFEAWISQGKLNN